MKLQFNPATHTYAWDGQVVPSVTQIIAPLVDYSAIPPGVLEAAADRGRRVHAATELVDRGTLDKDDLSEDLVPYVSAYEAWRRDVNPAILMSEHQVFHGIHRYAGTLDRIVGLDEEWLVDIKSSAEVNAAVGPQTAAYAEAVGMRLRRAVLHLRADGTYRWRELTSPRDWPIFQACLLVHRFRSENRNV